jgi:hypothetical protein
MATNNPRGSRQADDNAKASGATPEVRDKPQNTEHVSPGTPVPGAAFGTGTRALDRPAPYLSEGMRSDLETVGYAVDPVSGARYEVDKNGDVFVTEKGKLAPAVLAESAPDGPVHKVDVKVTPPATVIDRKTGVETVTDPVTGETRVTQPGSDLTTVTGADGETRTIDDPRT